MKRIVLADLFDESNGKPIQYEGKTIVMWDRFPLPAKECKIRYRILSTDSEWRQGMALQTEGELEFESGEIFDRGWADIWEDVLDWEGEFICRSKNGLLDLKNIWDTGNGCVESWHNGAAMWIEEISGGRRYHCNDGHFDDDFTDLVFELIVVE